MWSYMSAFPEKANYPMKVKLVNHSGMYPLIFWLTMSDFFFSSFCVKSWRLLFFFFFLQCNCKCAPPKQILLLINRIVCLYLCGVLCGYFRTCYMCSHIKCAVLVLITWRDFAVDAISHFRWRISCLSLCHIIFQTKSFSMPQVIVDEALHTENCLMTNVYVWDVRDLAATLGLANIFMECDMLKMLFLQCLENKTDKCFSVLLHTFIFCTNMEKAIVHQREPVHSTDKTAQVAISGVVWS